MGLSSPSGVLRLQSLLVPGTESVWSVDVGPISELWRHQRTEGVACTHTDQSSQRSRQWVRLRRHSILRLLYHADHSAAEAGWDGGCGMEGLGLRWRKQGGKEETRREGEDTYVNRSRGKVIRQQKGYLMYG